MEEEMKQATSLEREAHYTFLGFTIFDAIHLPVAIMMLVFSYINYPVWEMDAACAMVEIGLALLLIVFDVTLAKKEHGSAAALRRNVGYCVLICACADFIPASFWLPELVHGDWGAQSEIALLIITGTVALLSFTAVILFAVAQVLDERTPGGEAWRKFTFVANIFFLLASVSAIIMVIMERKFPTWLMVFECISKAAPFVPGIVIFIRLSRSPRSTDLY